MTISDLKRTLRQNGVCYMAGLLLLLLLKIYYSQADVNGLPWILAPTARLVSLLGGISFEFDARLGYVNHDYRFIIAPACSGVRFLTVVFAMLLFSFVHRFSQQRTKYLWLSGSLFFSYGFTLVVNAVRITLSIFLPALMERAGLFGKLLTPQRLHTLLGTILYFSALLFLYTVTQRILSARSHIPAPYFLIPALWYLLLVLILPLLVRILKRNLSGMEEFTVMILICSSAVTALFFLVDRIVRKWMRQ